MNITGDTPLHLAAKYGHTETCAELFRLGAHINITNVIGKILSYKHHR